MDIWNKIKQVDSMVVITLADNGYVFEVSGIDGNDKQGSIRYVVDSYDKLIELVTEATEMERTNK